VNEQNATQLMAQKDVDGLLVGGASLKVDSFVKILNY
jgi:triosephosphate isomerase